MSINNGVDETIEELKDMVLAEQLELQVQTALEGSVTLVIIKDHLDKMLSEHEAIFERFGKFESYDFADQYCEAALAARALGRQGDLVEPVREWMKKLETV